jgi:toxin FitB
MIILDTNVLSALMHQAPDANVVTWLDRQPRTSVWTTSVTLFEVRFGLQIMPTGKRRSLLMQAFESVLDRMGQRIASFDAAAAEEAADLTAARQRRGKPGDLRDTMIAGIVLAHRATLATRNLGHFEDLSVSVVNPWEP